MSADSNIPNADETSKDENAPVSDTGKSKFVDNHSDSAPTAQEKNPAKGDDVLNTSNDPTPDNEAERPKSSSCDDDAKREDDVEDDSENAKSGEVKKPECANNDDEEPATTTTDDHLAEIEDEMNSAAEANDAEKTNSGEVSESSDGSPDAKPERDLPKYTGQSKPKPSFGERLAEGFHNLGEKAAGNARSFGESARNFRMPTGEQAMGLVADGVCHLGTMLWILPFGALCWALYTLTYNGMLICSNDDVMPLAIAIGAGLVIALLREPILGAIDALTIRGDAASHWGGLCAETWRSLVGLLVCTICGVIAIETPWNENAADIATSFFLIDVVVIFCVLTFLFFLGQRTGWLVAVGLVACFALGIGQTFVIEFKGTALLPADLMALSTAAEVSSSYTYNVTTPMLGAALALAVGLIFCCLMRPCTAAPRRAWILRPVANFAIAFACFMGIQGAFYNVSLQEDFEVSTDIWWPINSYTSGGFLPHFLNLFQKMQISTPLGYTEEGATEAEQELASIWQASQGEERAAAEAQFNDIQPSVICVMNETFSDLSLLNGLNIDYTGPAYFNSISDALVRGSLEVSAYGGGTCNSEFEFMTGNSLGFIGSGNYPYTYYDLSNVQNLAAQFAELGYDTTAIHPNAPTNWNREEVYSGFGFNRFLSIDDFEGEPNYHSGRTDASTYQKILDQLASSDQPQFVLDVTMQNHSGYDQYNIPEEDMLDYTFDFDPDNTALTHQLNEYLSCINASDRDLEWFMNELRNLDRPVVLVFFGDHQPGMAGNVNDAIYTNEEEITHGARSYRTNYIVWTNYYVEGSGEMRWEDASSSTLGALALQYVGAPLTTYQQAALGARMSMPMVNMFAYKDNDGSWYSITDATPSEKTKSSGSDGGDDDEQQSSNLPTSEAGLAAANACRMLQNVQYLEFATKVI